MNLVILRLENLRTRFNSASSQEVLFPLLLNLVLFSLVFNLFHPALTWVFGQMLSAQNVVHIAALGLIIAISLRLIGLGRTSFLASFQFHAWPMAFLICGCLGFILNERFTGIHIFSAAFMLTASYGLLGFYLRQCQWRRALVPAALAILVLPFEGYLDVYLGFPLRLFSADLASGFLVHLGIPAMSAESVLLIENKAAIVDLDCSGLKGLWAGLIFYLAMTWIESKRLSLGWLVGLLLYLGTLVTFNVIRIIVLVALVTLADWPQAAHLAHTTLGVLGFTAACAVAWGILRMLRETTVPQLTAPSYSNTFHTKGMLLVIMLLAACTVLYQPFPKIEMARSGFASLGQMMASLPMTKVALTEKERAFFQANSALSAKYQLDWQGYPVSLLMVYGPYWKSQHDPRNCYTAQGYSLDHQKTLRFQQQLGDEVMEVRSLSLNAGDLSGLYWYQSATAQTADYSVRAFAGFREPQNPWVMVSMAWRENLPADVLESLVLTLGQRFRQILVSQHKDQLSDDRPSK